MLLSEKQGPAGRQSPAGAQLCHLWPSLCRRQEVSLDFLLVLSRKTSMSSCLPFLISSYLLLQVVKKKKKGIVALFLAFPSNKKGRWHWAIISLCSLGSGSFVTIPSSYLQLSHGNKPKLQQCSPGRYQQPFHFLGRVAAVNATNFHPPKLHRKELYRTALFP